MYDRVDYNNTLFFRMNMSWEEDVVRPRYRVTIRFRFAPELVLFDLGTFCDSVTARLAASVYLNGTTAR